MDLKVVIKQQSSMPKSDHIISAGLEGPVPQEVNKVSLFKDPIYEDFGFSVSDGLYERGIYINRIRKGGPADESGLLKPFDRILQINQVERGKIDKR